MNSKYVLSDFPFVLENINALPLRSYSSSATEANTSFRGILQNQIDDIKKAGTYKRERVITSPQATTITVSGSKGKILNFCANNYLGLSVS